MNDRFGKWMKMVGWHWKQREVTVVEDDEQLEADSFRRDAAHNNGLILSRFNS